ncbi:MAG TPA: TIGR00375 family protein [Thermoplasmatales archaeon]|nr:TIGR00375 family protein [Thermoplasmatales archaeon]
MIINADFHIHSPFSGGTSEKIDLKGIAEGALNKGLNLVGTGDCLHPSWQRHIKEYYNDGRIEVKGVNFILSVEVEDKNRVHHLILFPDFYSANDFKERVKKYSVNINDDGRPKLFMDGKEIFDVVREANAIAGASHAFTPWTSLYAYFDSVIDYYGKKPDFIELGLSADTNYADRIKELHSITFLTNSDAHSYSPTRLGREFNRMKVEEIAWDEIKNSILKGNIALNVGFPPEKGKYNRTACTSCYRQYEKSEAEKMKWKCHCGGIIKKGVRDRIDELADLNIPEHPPNRPPYLHLLPLAEIIGEALGINSRNSIVKKRWKELTKIGNEIEILLDIDINKIRKTTPMAIADAIEAFRKGRIKILPGGGGKYGEIVIT